MGIVWRKGTKRSVLIVFRIVKGRDIHAGKLSRFLQEIHPAAAIFPVFLIDIEQAVILGLPFSDIEQIKKLRQGLRIVSAGTTADHNGICFRPVAGMEGNSRQVQNLENIGITHFILKGDSQKIKILDRILAFQSKQRDFFLSHHPVQIHPRRKDPLTVNVLSPVEHIIQNLQPQMRHADLIHVREAHRKTDIHLLRVLHHRIDLAADIPGRFVNTQQNFIT